MATMEETELEMGNLSPTNNSAPFSIGNKVEVTREELGYRGAWYEAIIVEPNPIQKKRRGFFVQYKHLLSDIKDVSESIPKCEFITKRSLLRPAPPPLATVDERRSFKVKDVVDAFHLAGWWKGVVASVGGGDGGKGSRFRVAFKDPDEELEFSQNDLRLHVDWVGGKWVAPVSTDEKSGSSSAADQNKQKNSDSSQKAYVKIRKSRVVGSVDNQSSHVMEERIDCSPAETAHSNDRNKLGEDIVGDVIDRELNKEIMGTVVDMRTLAAEKPSDPEMPPQLGTSSAANNHTIKDTASSNKRLEMLDTKTGGLQPLKKLKSGKHVSFALENQEFPKRTRDKDGKLSDSGFLIVEGSSKRNSGDLSDHRSLAVTQGVEKQIVESTHHEVVNEQNATNQVELSLTSGINTSAGASAAADQPCVENSTQQPDGTPDTKLNSITTPKPSLVLPFRKNSTLWGIVESAEVFARSPQNPHFSPLAQYEENKREDVALQKMINYAYVVEKIPKLTTTELSNSSLINDMLAFVKDWEENGFDVILYKRGLNDILLNNERQNHFVDKLEEVDGRIKNCNLEKARAEKEIEEKDMKIKDLERELMAAKNSMETMDQEKKVMDQEMLVFRSEESAICGEIRHVQLHFEATVASLKQIFS
ncbi:DUF724 domain-containing protein 7 isoform X2 [Nicotiana tabacum]|uniref:DUF724 domain-containing protein 7 isoform X2 n=1 Tax=Nicotiana tabacum TaxID=4097 RepID=A0A1S3XRC4_TOBAC|nr:PREDICTED: uncharacterized protein LOC107767905 isoform X2 [Nicotiana tabacum]